MNWIVFFIYLLLFCWLITVIPFFKRSGISKKLLCALFILKVMAGIAYFQFYSLPANKATSDTWKFYNRSLTETDLLLNEPIEFARGVVTSKYASTGALFSDKSSYWNDVKDVLMVKLMAIVNVFTFKNYYANIIWFNFLFFFGLIGFYRLMKQVYPGAKWPLLVSIFLIPSFLFWCSGIHKDGLIFSALGLLLYSFQQLLNRRPPIKYLMVIAISLVLIFFLRNYLVFILVPCMILGTAIHFFPARKLVIIVSALLLGCLFVFGGKYIHPALDIPTYIMDKQTQFSKLEGNSAIHMPVLESSFKSFVTALPAAFDLGFLRPHLNEKGLSSLIASIEIILFWIVVLYCIIKRRSIASLPPVAWTCLSFAFLALLIIGYTVPFSGAIVRYRSLVLPLILSQLLVLHSYNKKIYMR